MTVRARSIVHASAVLALSAFATGALLFACSSGGDGNSAAPSGGDASLDATDVADASGTDGPSSSGTLDAGTKDASIDHDVGDASCDARIVECTVQPTQKSPTVNLPAVCGAPAFDAYSTTDNEQVMAACNDFCVQQNPSFIDAGGFVGCNQTPAEQALGTGAFHCVCAP